MQTMTGHASNPISRRAFESSVKKGGDFANGVTGAVAKGNISYTGSMTGTQAAQALSSYLGQTGIPDAPGYSGVEIGGGRIMGTETPPVCPTLMPRLDKKLSIFWLIFRNAMAHKNQMNTFPAAGMCQRLRCPDRADTPADPCMELYQAAV